MSGRLPTAVDRHVASRLRLRRQEAGITQTQLAQAVGVTFQQLQKYEGAVNRISAGALYQLALTLDVPVQYFFDGLSRRDGADSYLICGAAGAASRSFSERKSFAFFNPRELCGRAGNHAVEPRAPRGEAVVVFCTCRPLELVPASPYDRALYS